jgi:hypothetical protein
MKKRAALLQKFVHFMTAITIFGKAIAKLEHPHGYWPIIVFLFASGICVVTITILHDRLHHHERYLTASVYAIECIALSIAAWLSFGEGKRYLPWAFAFAAAMFFVAIVVRLTRKGAGNGAAPHEVRGA